jgi:transcriptional regulator with XRE-family HTH domain
MRCVYAWFMKSDTHMEAMTPALMRAARAILRWTASDLAERSGVSRATIQDYESGSSAARPRGMNKTSRAALARTILDAGIEFVGGDAPGIVVRRGELLD